MTRRLFAAVRPPEPVRDELEDFLSARPGMPWIDREQWHVTLAFFEQVADHRVDDLEHALGRTAARQPSFSTRISGAGCFPSVERAAVLWLGLPNFPATLGPAARTAGNSVGATPDGRAFVPHLTIARLHRRIEATKWLRVLDTFTSTEWQVTQVELVESFLGEGRGGRPRYETVACAPLDNTRTS